jgi:hypothetical protein
MLRTFSVITLAALVVSRTVLAFDVSGCDTTVPAGETGTLVADTSCLGAFVGVALSPGATLALNGNSLSGNPSGGALVRCLDDGPCTILGPGSIVGTDGGPAACVDVPGGHGRLVMEQGLVQGCGTGIEAGPSDGRGRVTISDATISANGRGLRARTLRARNLIVSVNASEGMVVGTLRAEGGVSVTGNGGVGISANAVRGLGVGVSLNGGSGVFGNRIKVRDFTAVNNVDCGVRTVRASLLDSSLSGNGGLGLGGDVCTVRKPHLRNSTCGRSLALGATIGTTWGVCTSD